VTDQDASEESSPPTLYHYTDQRGLLGILNSFEFWATKIQYLNDASEFGYTQALVREELANLHRQAPNDRERERIDALVLEIDTIRQINVCVFSFSEERDLLSQWRAYGGPTAGFAIGFETAFLKTIVKRNGWLLKRCIYDEATQIGMIRGLIQDILSTDFNTVRSRTDPTRPRTTIALPVGGDFAVNLTRLAQLLKHRGFAEEREWRLVSPPQQSWDERFCYRLGRSMITPYFRLSIHGDGELPKVREIVVGPTPERGGSIASVESIPGSRSRPTTETPSILPPPVS
jgi:hypothetical protein